MSSGSPVASADAPAPASASGPEAEWAERLRSVTVSKATMDRLVMNWLVIEGYQEAAQRFMVESGTDGTPGLRPAATYPPSRSLSLARPPAAGVDLETVSDRMAIRNAIQCGDVQQAIERVNALDSTILEGNAELSFKLKQQQLVELIRSGDIEASLTFAQEELAPLAENDAGFLEEMESTMLLLAYEDLSQAPTAELCSQAARQKTVRLDVPLSLPSAALHTASPPRSRAASG